MNELQEAEKSLYELTQKVAQLRRTASTQEVKNYNFKTSHGEVSLLDLFADKEKLFVIHNMGQSCRYCTLWADGLNGFLPHLESQFAVALVSKDSPETQTTMANNRGWRFKMASHGGQDYIQEQSVTPGEKNYPGVVCYKKDGDKILKMNSAAFGPGDEFCSFWNLLSLSGDNVESFTPQFNYWMRPEQMDDGGENLN